MKEETIRKICFLAAAMIFMLGVWGVLTRKDPIEKNIGNVYISDGTEETAIKGHKVTANYKGKKTEYEYPDIKESPDKIFRINASSENNGSMKISYSKEYYGEAEYSIYDSDFNVISEKQSSLNIPVDSGKVYYVSALITWGSENENISLMYYFSVQT